MQHNNTRNNGCTGKQGAPLNSPKHKCSTTQDKRILHKVLAVEPTTYFLFIYVKCYPEGLRDGLSASALKDVCSIPPVRIRATQRNCWRAGLTLTGVGCRLQTCRAREGQWFDSTWPASFFFSIPVPSARCTSSTLPTLQPLYGAPFITHPTNREPQGVQPPQTQERHNTASRFKWRWLTQLACTVSSNFVRRFFFLHRYIREKTTVAYNATKTIVIIKGGLAFLYVHDRMYRSTNTRCTCPPEIEPTMGQNWLLLDDFPSTRWMND